MKQIKLTLLLAIVLVLAVAVGSASAQGNAYSASLSSSITYQNVGDATANIVFSFYSENSATPITVDRQLAKGAGASLFVGSLTEISSGFSGSAVASSDQPIVATMVQIFDSGSGVKNRPLSNGFAGGSSEVLLATVLKNRFNTTTVFSVQNTGASATNITVNLFNADNPAGAPISVVHNNLPAGAAKYFDLGEMSQVPNNFNGSAVISAASGEVVATALELSTTGTAASSFEGVSGGANTVYMASALCNAFGASSAYAVQNTSSSENAVVTVAYAGGGTDNATILPGAKKSFQGCAVNSAGYSGSATITSTGGAIVAIGKVSGSGNSTAFVGATSGSSKLALPYVRFTTADWANGSKQRAFIAVQNIGGALNAGDVKIEYLDRNGVVVGTHTLGALATGQKANSNPKHASVVGNAADLNEFGYVGGFGGSAIITGPAGSQLVAVVRIQSVDGAGVVGEDYNDIPIN